MRDSRPDGSRAADEAVAAVDLELRTITPPPPSAALLAAVSRGDAVATRRPGRILVAVILVSLGCAFAVLAWIIGLRRDLGTLSLFPVVLYATACVGSFAAHMAAALLPAARDVLPFGSRSARLSIVLTLITVPLGLYVGMHVGAHRDDNATVPVLRAHDFWPTAWACVSNGFAVVAAPVFLGAVALWRIVPLGGWKMALPVGAAAGVLAGLALQFHCPITDAAHLGVAHTTVMVAPALILALLAARRF